MNQSISQTKQQGAALIVALILVLVSTLLGASAMKNSTVETRLSNNEIYSAATFRQAERAALIAIESADISLMMDTSTTTDPCISETVDTDFKVDTCSQLDGLAPWPGASINQFRAVMLSVSSEATIPAVSSKRTVRQGASQRVLAPAVN